MEVTCAMHDGVHDRRPDCSFCMPAGSEPEKYNEQKPAPYEWQYATISGESRCIGLVRGKRNIMIVTGDGHSSWLDFAPTAKTMILYAVNGRNERSRKVASEAALALDREALARMVGGLQAQIDCGGSPRDGCLNPKQVCLMCQLADANSIARERTKEACDLTAQLVASRAETSQLQTRLKQTQGDLMLTRDALDVCLDDRNAARDKTERVTEQVKQLRAELAEVKTDDITDSWWVSFERMLSQEQLDAIGLSEDRGATVCIARLANAYVHAERQAERQQRAFHQSLRAQVDARGEVERLRAELEQERSSHANTRHQWVNTQMELGRQCAIRDEKNYEVNRLRATLVQVTAQVRIIQECATKATCGDLPCAVHEMTPREFEIFQATTSYVGALEFVSEAAATIAAIVAASATDNASGQKATAEGQESDDAEQLS